MVRGVTDIGGGYPESESQLSQIALRWMVCEAELAGLIIDAIRKAEILGGKPPIRRTRFVTRNQHDSLHGWWWIAELWPKIVRVLNPQGVWKNSNSCESSATQVHR